MRWSEPSASTRMLPSTATSVNGRSRSASSAIVEAPATCSALMSPPERADSRSASVLRVASSSCGRVPVTPGAAAPVTTAHAPNAMRSVSSRGATDTASPAGAAPSGSAAPEPSAASPSRSAATSTAPSPRACWAASSPTCSGFSTANRTISATSFSDASRMACNSSGGMENSCSTRFLMRTAMSESRPRSSSASSLGRSSGLYPIEEPMIRASLSLIDSPEAGFQRVSASSSSSSPTTGASDSSDSKCGISGAVDGSIGAPPLTAPEATITNDADSSSDRAWTCRDAPPGCGVRVVVTDPEAGRTPGRSTAVRVAPSITAAAAADISASTLGTTSARTCHAWRPSGSATYDPGMRPSPDPPPAVTLGHRVRRFHAVPGTGAYRSGPVT